MRLYKFCVVSVISSMLSLAACGTKTDPKPEIYKQVSQSDFFTNSATVIKCEESADYPAAQYHRLCFQINPVIIPSLDKAGETGLNLGLKTQAVLKDLDWEFQTDDRAGFHYLKVDENGCRDKLIIVFSEVDNFASNDGEFPMQLSPILTFLKSRRTECAKT